MRSAASKSVYVRVFCADLPPALSKPPITAQRARVRVFCARQSGACVCRGVAGTGVWGSRVCLKYCEYHGHHLHLRAPASTCHSCDAVAARDLLRGGHAGAGRGWGGGAIAAVPHKSELPFLPRAPAPRRFLVVVRAARERCGECLFVPERPVVARRASARSPLCARQHAAVPPCSTEPLAAAAAPSARRGSPRLLLDCAYHGGRPRSMPR